MIYTQALLDELLLQGDHVGIVVLREAGVQAVTGFAGFSMADVVGQDDEIFGCVEQLSRAEQHAGKNRSEQTVPVSSGTVKDQDRIRGTAARVLDGLAESCIVHANFRHGLARLKMKIMDDEVALLGGGPCDFVRGCLLGGS